MSPNSSIPSQIPPFSEREVFLLSRRLISPPPSYLTTSHLLETLLHQLFFKFILFTDSFLCVTHLQVTSIFQDNSFSILVTPGAILSSFHLLLCQKLSALQHDFHSASRPFNTIPEDTEASSVVLSFNSSKSPTACSVLQQHVQKFLSPSHITSGFHGIMETLNFLSERNKAKKN